KHCDLQTRNQLVKTNKHWHALTPFILEKMHYKIAMRSIVRQFPRLKTYKLEGCQTFKEIRDVVSNFLKTLSAIPNLEQEKYKACCAIFNNINKEAAKTSYLLPKPKVVFSENKDMNAMVIENYILEDDANDMELVDTSTLFTDPIDAFNFLMDSLGSVKS